MQLPNPKSFIIIILGLIYTTSSTYSSSTHPGMIVHDALLDVISFTEWLSVNIAQPGETTLLRGIFNLSRTHSLILLVCDKKRPGHQNEHASMSFSQGAPRKTHSVVFAYTQATVKHYLYVQYHTQHKSWLYQNWKRNKESAPKKNGTSGVSRCRNSRMEQVTVG